MQGAVLTASWEDGLNRVRRLSQGGRPQITSAEVVPGWPLWAEGPLLVLSGCEMAVRWVMGVRAFHKSLAQTSGTTERAVGLKMVEGLGRVKAILAQKWI